MTLRMKNRTFLAVFFYFSTFFCSNSYAYGTTKEMYEQCKGIKTESISAEILACLAYASGFKDGVFIQKVAVAARHGIKLEEIDQKLSDYCLPEGSDNGQRIRVFLKWVDENPEKEQQPASISFMQALSSAFPCDN